MAAVLVNDYLKNAILTASPEQLHLMLIDGAIRFCLQAKDALAAKDLETFVEKICRGRAIIVELQTGLRPEVAPELCDRMRGIYNFLYRNLVQASVERSTLKLDDVLRVLQEERKTWALIHEKVSATRAPISPHEFTTSTPVQSIHARPPVPEALVAGSLNLQG